MTAGILPIELATINRHALIEVNEAPAVTKPEGTNGKIRNKIIRINVYKGELFWIALKIE